MGKFIHKLIIRVIPFFIIIIGSNTSTYSCSTPVFRFALEMWPAYRYVVEIIHDGNLSSSQKHALNLLREATSSDVSVNLKIIEKVQNNNNESEWPIMKMTFPVESKIPGTLWQGALTTENVEKIINSPSRKLVLENVRKGDAVVWLFLESGNAERDAKQVKILEEELKRLSRELKLSETATDVAGNLLDIKVINTGVNFSLVRIDRNDPLEEVFINILLGTEVDLQFFKNVPLAFPMFGRGRVLYALAGNGIKSKNIETACSTIIGWCSCTIKDDNPGTDLLFKANWDTIIGDSSWIQQVEVPDITGLSGFISDEVQVDEKIEVEKEIPKNADSMPEIEVEESLVAEVNELPESTENEPELILEPVKVNNKILNSSLSEDNQNHHTNPLLRNSLIAFGLFLVIIIATLFIIKRK
jgi:hypothetical protein